MGFWLRACTVLSYSMSLVHKTVVNHTASHEQVFTLSLAHKPPPINAPPRSTSSRTTEPPLAPSLPQTLTHNSPESGPRWQMALRGQPPDHSATLGHQRCYASAKPMPSPLLASSAPATRPAQGSRRADAVVTMAWTARGGAISVAGQRARAPDLLYTRAG